MKLFAVLSCLFWLPSIILGQRNESIPVNYAVVVYPAFQALDVFGPLDMFNILSINNPLNLYVLAKTLDPVSTQHHMPTTSNSNFSETIVPTHTFDTAPDDIEVLIIPGGLGARAASPELDPLVEFIKNRYPKLKYLIAECTGAGIVARTGILDGVRATGNKRSWAWVTAQSNKVKWVSNARWVHSGNIWTTSGISAALDGVYDYVKFIYGEEATLNLANSLEYTRELDWSNDPFSKLYNLTDPIVSE